MRVLYEVHPITALSQIHPRDKKKKQSTIKTYEL